MIINRIWLHSVLLSSVIISCTIISRHAFEQRKKIAQSYIVWFNIKISKQNVLQIVQLIDIQISTVMGFFQKLVKFDTLLRMLLFLLFLMLITSHPKVLSALIQYNLKYLGSKIDINQTGLKNVLLQEGNYINQIVSLGIDNLKKFFSS